MNEYPTGSTDDRKMLRSIPPEELLDYLFLQIRNLWRVDGLYFLSIEKKFGTEAAIEVDAGVWEAMAIIEAKSLQRMFKIDESPDITKIMELLQKSSWALDQPFKTTTVNSSKAILSIRQCRTQEARLNKGLTEFPCKRVRHAYLRNFAKTLNPKTEVNCIICPPDKHSKNEWCKWEFTL